MSDQPSVSDRKQLTPAAQRALAEAEARLAGLAHDTDELGRRLGSAIAKVERLMES